ncbi:MAG: pyruvate kinase [Ignavibacteria bacterium]|nr:pyruvate kinase [Ignavibacteria bacterium]
MLIHKAKILCTMGPAVASVDKIIGMINAGASAFRLNMSHGAYASHLLYIEYIRKAEKKLNAHVPIIADLQGPKIRVGDFPDRDTIVLAVGTDVKLADVGTIKSKKLPPSDTLIPVQYPTIAKDVKKGHVLLLDDGLMKLQVKSTDGEIVTCLVVYGGLLKERKGINLPNTKVSQPSMTSKDRADVRFAIENNCDYIALSFVRTAADIELLRKYVVKHGGNQWLISKIEKPEALDNIEAIVKVSDAVMVARGDLGVEIPAEAVPIVQKKIIHLCNTHAKPVITATQMLESMIRNPRPTRAEASDVANAVLDGTDAVMLSAETSVGAYPIEAVAYMRSICTSAEEVLMEDGHIYDSLFAHADTSLHSNTHSIALAAARIAEEARVSAIACLSYSGETARLISNKRPRAPILAISTLDSVARKMGLLWGVTGIVFAKITTTDDTMEEIKTALVKSKMFKTSDIVVFTIGRPLIGRARTNMLSIETL